MRAPSLARTQYVRLGLCRLLATSTAPAFKIPVIDFGLFREATTKAERDAAAAQVVNALVTAGFMVRASSLASLSRHDINVETLVYSTCAITASLKTKSTRRMPSRPNSSHCRPRSRSRSPGRVRMAQRSSYLLKGLIASYCSNRPSCKPRLGRSWPGARYAIGRPWCVRSHITYCLAIRLTTCRYLRPGLADEIAKLRMTRPDFKESMEVGRERDPGDVEPLWKNEWPPAGVVRITSLH